MKLMSRLRRIEARKTKITSFFVVHEHKDGTYSRNGVRYGSIEAVDREAAKTRGQMVVITHMPEHGQLPPELAREATRQTGERSCP